MKTKLSFFSLIELLITLAMILILAGLLLPVLQRTRSKAMDLSCQNMEKQIALAASQYILDNDDWILPAQDVESTDGSHRWFTLLAGNRTMQEVYTPPYGIRYSKMARNRNLAVSRRYSNLICPVETRGLAWSAPFGGTHYGIARIAGNPAYPDSGSGFQMPSHKLSAVKNASRVIFFAENVPSGEVDAWGTHSLGTHNPLRDTRPRMLAYRHGGGSVQDFTTASGTTNLAYIDGHVASRTMAYFKSLAGTVIRESDGYRWDDTKAAFADGWQAE